MAERLLVILVSDTLRRGDFLGISQDRKDILTVGDRTLTIQKEPSDADDPWDSELQATVVDKIRSMQGWEAAQVRIAAHMRCFRAEERRLDLRDRRFSDKEEQLKKKLPELKVHVWGFHHDPASSIWQAVSGRIINIKTAADSDKIDFLNSLEAVFQKGSVAASEIVSLEESQRVWDQLSWLRHQVLGLFHPLLLRLDTARERDQKKSENIRASVLESLGPKLEKAREFLKQCRPVVTDETLKPLNVIFNTPPDLKPAPPDKPQPFDNFREWLNKLDSELNKLRGSLSKE